MKFFPSKKHNKSNGSLRKLSEDEIRNKLYGRYLVSTETEKEAVRHESERLQADEDTAPYDEGPEEDLFEQDNETGSLAPDEAEDELQLAPAEEELPRKSDPEQIKKWLDEENRITKKVVIAPASEFLHKKSPVKSKKTNENLVRKAAFWGGRYLWNVIRTIIAGILGLFIAIDFKKPVVRRMLYWLGACAILSILFIAINYLNVKREAAMSGGNVQKVKTSAAVRDSTKEGQSKATNQNKEKAETQMPADSAGTEKQSAAAAQTAAAILAAEISEAEAKPYVIQVATYLNDADAQRSIKMLEGVSIPIFIRPLRHSDGRMFYSVFLGRFESFKDAQKALSNFKSNEASGPFGDAFIRTLKN